MEKALYTVKFIPDGLETTVEAGSNLLEAALSAGVHISASCGSTGVCGTCKVRIETGSVSSPPTEKITAAEFQRGIRLACQSRILSDLTVFVPVESRLDKAVQAREKVQLSGVSASGWSFSPPLKKYYLELSPPTLDDNASDLSRLLRGLQQHYNLADIPVDFDVIRKLPAVLRESQWKVTVTTVVVSDKMEDPAGEACQIINVEPGDTRRENYALAVDVGTTTVCAQLLDLNRGSVLAESIVFNRQIHYGADVISRIAYTQKPNGLRKLQMEVVDSINETIDELIKISALTINHIGHITVAGNTTMQQILLGLDPKYIRLAPYTPAANFIPPVKASSLGIHAASQALVYIFPSVSSYIGGDIVSGIIAAGVHQRPKLTFYMDIGTNGEIVIGNSEWMVTASCSAGPAFEGGGIKHGMVAMPGAIQDFSLDPDTFEPGFQTIGGVDPKGICGSGLINAIAAFLEAGVISRNGKFNSHLSTKRIREGADGLEYVLAWAAETQIGKDIVITEVDIDNLIRAKAAMYAGCHTLSRSVNISCSDFEQVILAGNFGSSLNIDKAITIGLLPDIPRDRFVFIGNGSLSGARLVNYSIDLLRDARKVARMMTNIELSENSDFTHNYVAALFLPHTDEKAFPTINGNLNNPDHSLK